MADYIDRKALLDSICGNILVTHRPGEPSLEIRGANKVINFIEEAPAADVVEVVRCRDCEHGEIDDPDFPNQYYCHAGCGWNDAGFYCGYGERRDNDGQVD